MMASLRARLLAAVLALTACGLLLAGAITYVEQRSFQYDRVDQQLQGRGRCRSAAALERHDGRPRPGGHDGPDDRPAGGRGGGPNFGIPAGTYGQKRDASGQVHRRPGLQRSTRP